MKKKLDSYRGRLSPTQVAAGMNAATKNAGRLAKDAANLLESGSFATAASIAILSIEEAGKVSILRTLALAKSDAEAAETWKEYRSHTRKNVAWLLPQLAAAGARKLDDLQPLFYQTSDHPFILDQIKQLGFYTDCLANAHWAIPPGSRRDLLLDPIPARTSGMKPADQQNRSRFLRGQKHRVFGLFLQPR